MRSASAARRWSSCSTASAPAASSTGSRAGCRRGRGLLHDRQLGPREQCRRRFGPPARRHGLPPLPLGRLPDPPFQAAARPDAGLGHAAQLHRFRRGSDLGGRHKVLGSKPLFIRPDQHHRLASAQGGRRGVQHRPRTNAEAGKLGPAPGFDRAVQLRRRLGQPFDRAGAFNSAAWAGYQDARCRSSSCARTMASASRPERRGAGSRRRSRPRRAPLCALQRHRHGRRLPRRQRSRRSCPPRAQAGLPAHGLRAALRPCRLRRSRPPI